MSLATLSALLWAAFGVNRRNSKGRTAPSAHNAQEISIIATLPEGAYRYDAASHRLLFIRAENLRGTTGQQDDVATAPLNLVYVADFARMLEAQPEDRGFLAGAGLGTVVRGLIDRRRLAAALGLSTTERVILAQCVGRAEAA